MVWSLFSVLFGCAEISCRSQMAEAFARMRGEGVSAPYISGPRPSGNVNGKAVVVMKALGYDLSAHVSKSLDDIPQMEYDLVVTAGCGDHCPQVRVKRREDWAIPDPKALDMARFAEIRDLIGEKVCGLIAQVKATDGDAAV